MGIELEAKIKVDSLAAVRERLSAVGGQRVGAVLERNHIFDDAARSLLAGDRGLRVRGCRHEDGRESATLTYKGPQRAGQLKHREEIEVAVGDSADACQLLQALGYQQVLSFQKRRETWKLQDSQIELDELPHLGAFVEIEGADAAGIERARAELGLQDHPLIRQTYIALLVEFSRALNLPPVITFSKP